MTSNALFHVIDAKTTYNVLLGRPWLHENGVIPSTLHQCFKYCRDGQVKTMVADSNPFTIAESYYADAKFYTEKTNEVEVQHNSNTIKKANTLTKPIGKMETRNIRRSTSPAKPKGEDKNKVLDQNKPLRKTPTLHYVIKLTVAEKQVTKQGKKDFVKNLTSFTLPVTSLKASKSPKPLLKEFAKSNQGSSKHQELPIRRMNGFDLNAYKLLANAGHDIKSLVNLTKDVVEEDASCTSQICKVWKENASLPQASKVGLGYNTTSPLRVKICREVASYITVKEEEVEGIKTKEASSSKPYVFSCLGRMANRTSIFDRIRSFVFNRIDDSKDEALPPKR